MTASSEKTATKKEFRLSMTLVADWLIMKWCEASATVFIMMEMRMKISKYLELVTRMQT